MDAPGSRAESGTGQSDRFHCWAWTCYIGEVGATILCIKCSATGIVGAHAVESEEVMPKLVQTVVCDIANMGDTKVAIKDDNEPSMKALGGRVKDIGSHPSWRNRPRRSRRPSASLIDACRRTRSCSRQRGARRSNM